MNLLLSFHGLFRGAGMEYESPYNVTLADEFSPGFAFEPVVESLRDSDGDGSIIRCPLILHGRSLPYSDIIFPRAISFRLFRAEVKRHPPRRDEQ